MTPYVYIRYRKSDFNRCCYFSTSCVLEMETGKSGKEKEETTKKSAKVLEMSTMVGGGNWSWGEKINYTNNAIGHFLKTFEF